MINISFHYSSDIDLLCTSQFSSHSTLRKLTMHQFMRQFRNAHLAIGNNDVAKRKGNWVIRNVYAGCGHLKRGKFYLARISRFKAFLTTPAKYTNLFLLIPRLSHFRFRCDFVNNHLLYVKDSSRPRRDFHHSVLFTNLISIAEWNDTEIFSRYV